MNAVSVVDLTRLFGDFVAVDHVSFEVRKGESDHELRLR